MNNPLEIFYIEDDVSIAQAVKEYFEQLNYKITVFPMIEEAKKTMLKFTPAIVLIDWNMPDGQGDDLCRWIRSKWDNTGNYVNDNTLTVTMKRLREKLHNPTCLKTIRSFGYRMEDTV